MSAGYSNTERTARNGKQQTKGQDKNKHQHGRQDVSKKYEPDAFDVLLKIISDKESKIDSLEKRNEELEKRSMEITKVMAKVTETKGSFENANDGLSNTNVTERFSKLYDADWVTLSKWLIQTYSTIPELEMIHNLTDLMRNGYRECLQISDDQIRQFLLLDESQDIPTFVNSPEVYAVRKPYVQTETALTRVKRIVLEKILPSEEKNTFYAGDKNQETKQRLQEFLCKYLDSCWLMIVSVPPISLNFEVIGKQYCKDHFRKYSCKKPVKDERKENDTVCEVVWPCVCLQDGSAFYKKGDVVVVTKEMVGKDKIENTECSCLITEVCDSRVKASSNKKEKSTGNMPYQTFV